MIQAMTKTAVACIGNGFVGGSLTTCFSERGFDVYTYDKSGKRVVGGQPAYRPNPERMRTHQYEASSIAELVAGCESEQNFSSVYFVCVPTPMFEDGSADLSIVESVLDELASVSRGKCLKCEGTGTEATYPCRTCNGECLRLEHRIAVVKSTVPPGSTEKWNKKYESGSLRVVFNPEFLTEANALDDMRNQTRIVLGGPRPHINRVKQIFQTAFPKVPIIKTSSTTAEMVKYFINVQLAARVVLSCELAQICEALDKTGLDIDYDKVVEYANYDKRLGGSHMNVPGNDGLPGAKGHCFTKDLNALAAVARAVDVKPTVMDAVWKKNLEIVLPEHRDWEKMVGRAVSKKQKS